MTIEPRNIGVAILLSILTCGIYYFYWIYKVTNEVSYLTGDSSFRGGLTVLLGIITCSIYFWFWYYQLGEKLSELQTRDSQATNNDSILLVILAVLGFGIVAIAIAQSNLNKVVQ